MNVMEMLAKLNVDIGAAEDAGDIDFLGEVLASGFAMRRAKGAVVDREQYLKEVGKSGPRSTVVSDIRLVGETRALVTCQVELSGVIYDNLRLFIRDDGRWRLLAWANEPT